MAASAITSGDRLSRSPKPSSARSAVATDHRRRPCRVSRAADRKRAERLHPRSRAGRLRRACHAACSQAHLHHLDDAARRSDLGGGGLLRHVRKHHSEGLWASSPKPS